VTTDEILTQLVASRNAGDFDPVRGRVRDHYRPASIHDPQVRVLTALAGVELSNAERRALLWLLDWDSMDDIAPMIEKRTAVLAEIA
jgi:hypothetical protein